MPADRAGDSANVPPMRIVDANIATIAFMKFPNGDGLTYTEMPAAQNSCRWHLNISELSRSVRLPT